MPLVSFGHRLVGDVGVEGLSAGSSPGSVSNSKGVPVYLLAKLGIQNRFK